MTQDSADDSERINKVSTSYLYTENISDDFPFMSLRYQLLSVPNKTDMFNFQIKKILNHHCINFQNGPLKICIFAHKFVKITPYK